MALNLTMKSKYKPTTACRTRMMQAIEYANRKGQGLPSVNLIFRNLQHEANEGTHAGHFKALEELYKFYGE